MIAIAYLISGVVSLLAFLTAFMLVNFYFIYYTSLAWTQILSALIAAPLLLPFLANCHALIRKINDKPAINIHRNICGAFGALTCLAAVPSIAIDRDWAFGSTAVIAGLLIALPFFLGPLSPK